MKKSRRSHPAKQSAQPPYVDHCAKALLDLGARANARLHKTYDLRDQFLTDCQSYYRLCRDVHVDPPTRLKAYERLTTHWGLHHRDKEHRELLWRSSDPRPSLGSIVEWPTRQTTDDTVRPELWHVLHGQLDFTDLLLEVKRPQALDEWKDIRNFTLQLQFESHLAGYHRIVSGPTIDPRECRKAWRIITRYWGVRNPGSAPQQLVWDPPGTPRVVCLRPDTLEEELYLGGNQKIEMYGAGYNPIHHIFHRSPQGGDDPLGLIRSMRRIWFSAYLVTRAQFRQVMGCYPNVDDAESDPDSPATGMTWAEVTEFLNRISRRFRHEFRLPTLVECRYQNPADHYRGYAGISINAQLTSFSRMSGSDGLNPVALKHSLGVRSRNARTRPDQTDALQEYCLDLDPRDLHEGPGQSPRRRVKAQSTAASTYPSHIALGSVIRREIEEYPKLAYEHSSISRYAALAFLAQGGSKSVGLRIVARTE